MIKIISSVPGAVAFAVRVPLEVIYCSADNNFYCVVYFEGDSFGSFHLVWRRCKSEPRSSEFYLEAKAFLDFMKEVHNNA